MKPDNFFAPVLLDKDSTKKKNKPGAGRPRKSPTLPLFRRIDVMKFDRAARVLDAILADPSLLAAVEETMTMRSKHPDPYSHPDQHTVH